MKINIVCFVFLIAIFSLIAFTHSSSSSSPSPSISFLGIAPQDENYYKQDTIKCKNGSKKFTRAQLNDDFCDCPDGTDEPGTSACPQGKFHCQNTGHVPISLHSAKVNDGICDCCDGSDEYDGHVKCPNTCWEAGKAARDKLQKKIDIYKEGVNIRKKEVEQAKQAIAKDKEELTNLKNEEKILNRRVKQLKVHKEQIEKAEEKERLEKEKEEKMKKVAEDKGDAGDKSDDGQKENLEDSDDNKIGLPEEPSRDQHEHDEYESSEGLTSERPESTEGLSKEELGRLVASRWTGEKTVRQVEEIATAKDNNGGKNEMPESTYDEDYDNVDGEESSAGNDLKGFSDTYASDSEEQKDLPGITTLSSPSWLERIQDTVRNLFQSVNSFSTPLDKLDANHVRKEYDDSTSRLSDIQARISSLTEKLKHDFGKEKEFYLFYDQCFETKQDKYVYKVCPFKEASQEEGYRKTQLGHWEKFENFYSIMLFANGDGCWNGPDRSLKVKLRCGLKTELTDVDEPSRCEYVAVLSNPVHCLEGKLQELEHELASLYKEQPHGHDEL